MSILQNPLGIHGTALKLREQRIAVLKYQINYWIHNVTEKTIETVELFY